MKEQLESVILQMYKAGMRCSEAVREFQKIFILTVLKDQRGSQSKLPRNSAYTGIRCAVRSDFWRLTSALLEQWGVGGRRERRGLRRCDDERHSSTLVESRADTLPQRLSRTSRPQATGSPRCCVRTMHQLSSGQSK